jgi:nucleoid-associated protein YgaU|tara:strand:+ start:432 stop:710 length:279 start_codon:yes stop_codon:yes gene_type:complete
MLKNRGVASISQYRTPSFSYPPPEVRARIKTVNHVWTLGDHFYKLSYKYYGNPTYWWVIGFYNQLPTEELLEYGDIIRVPISLEQVLSAIGY